MAVRIKFCGLTRAEDVVEAEALGADYIGVIFAGGPRLRTMNQAAELIGFVERATTVGVFGAATPDEIMRYVSAVPVSVAQLHHRATPASVAAVRGAGAREVWAVVPVIAGELPDGAAQLFLTADAVVLDTGAANGLGGTGRSFDWGGIAERLAEVKRTAKLVVAGGLNDENVRDAIRLLNPDVVDVSSGVESSPGVKDSKLMRRFSEAARSA